MALGHLAGLAGIASLTSPAAGAAGDASEFCMETEGSRRVDLNTYDVDADSAQAAQDFRAFAREQVRTGRALIQYRSAAFFEELAFALPSATALGPPHRIQRLFEAKPWVEHALRVRRIPVIDWRPLRRGDKVSIAALLENGPVVVRSGLGAGGARMHLLDTLDQYDALVSVHEDGWLWMSRFIDAIPLNVNACVYRNGVIRTFGVSLQLIGIPVCTTRRLGYCGNDFAAAAMALDGRHLERVAWIAERIGRWMRSFGYVGLFGVDLVLGRDGPVVAEVNPRFQGSTPLAAEVCLALNQPEPFSEHIAACLGLEPPRMLSEPELALRLTRLPGSSVAQAIFYNTTGRPQHFALGKQPPGVVLGEPARNVSVDADAMWCKVVFDTAVTRTGYELIGPGIEAASSIGPASS